jgi:large subunit ribosomal protein L30
MLKITLRKSLIGYEKSQRRTAEALGLGRVGSTVTQPDNGPVRGMVRKLVHVLAVEKLVDAAPAKPARKPRIAAVEVVPDAPAGPAAKAAPKKAVAQSTYDVDGATAKPASKSKAKAAAEPSETLAEAAPKRASRSTAKVVESAEK